MLAYQDIIDPGGENMTGKENLNNMHRNSSLGSPALPLLKETIPYESCLTVEDVEQASGLRNVNNVPYHPSQFMGGDLNFVNDEGEKILCVVFSTASQFEQFKSSIAEGSATSAAGVGDEAFTVRNSAGQATHVLAFRKRGHAAFLIAPVPVDERKIRLTLPQLVAVGKIISARLV